jgi:cytochrome P450
MRDEGRTARTHDLEPRIAEVTTELLDATGGGERLDLIESLAYPLPVIVIAELLGIPSTDRPTFRRWADHHRCPHFEISHAAIQRRRWRVLMAASMNNALRGITSRAESSTNPPIQVKRPTGGATSRKELS